MGRFPVLIPDVQADFYYRLLAADANVLLPALSETIKRQSVPEMDKQLSEYVEAEALQELASYGLRGEVFFSIPLILTDNPRLIGYYRTLYGFSQKEWYHQGPFGRFLHMENRGRLTAHAAELLPALCTSANQTGAILLGSLTDVSLRLMRDLQLLTLGPQFRGSRNTRLGVEAGTIVHGMMRSIIGKHVKSDTQNQLTLVNDSGRIVIVAFADDPDVSVTSVSGDVCMYLLAVEIKGGSDASNVLNRLGEAEKSHQKARELGFNERWTILKVPFPHSRAKKASPSTTQFFNLDELISPTSEAHLEFAHRLCATLGIAAPIKD